MQLDVKSDDANFINYLINEMSIWFWDNFNPKKIIAFQQYVDMAPKYKSLFIKKLDVTNCCKIALDNLKAEHYSTRYIIKIDDSIIVYGTNIQLKEIINLITFGNLLLQPYPIFVDMFNYFNNNIGKYFNEYYKEN